MLVDGGRLVLSPQRVAARAEGVHLEPAIGGPAELFAVAMRHDGVALLRRDAVELLRQGDGIAAKVLRVNDLHGAARGVEVHERVAAVLDRQIREEHAEMDVAVRGAGDPVVVVALDEPDVRESVEERQQHLAGDLHRAAHVQLGLVEDGRHE